MSIAPVRLSAAWRLGALAAVIAASVAGWYWMACAAREFAWGRDHAARPIVAVMLMLGAQWAGWGIAVWLSRRLRSRQEFRVLGMCFAAGLCAHLFFLNTNPIQEHDGYRYLWDGATVASGVSPYRYAPREIAEASLDTPEAAKRKLRARLRTEPDAAGTFEKIGYPTIKTIYPPVAQAAFFAAFEIRGWSWSGLRIVFVCAYFAGVVLTAAALQAGSARHAALMLALCPLAVKEVGNSAHLDALLVLIFGAMLFVVSRENRITPVWMAVALGLLMALAIATKLYPIILAPIFLAWLWSRLSSRIAVVFVLTVAAGVACAYLPFLMMGERDFFSGLTAFGNSWRRNDSLFGVIQYASTSALGTSEISMTGIPGASGPAGTVAAKCIAHALLAGACAVCTRHVFLQARSQSSVRLICRFTALLILAWFLLLPMAYPWYLLGALPFLAGARLGVMTWVLVAFVAVFYYGIFYIDYHALPAHYGTALLRIEYGVPLTVALIVWMVQKRAARAGLQAAPLPGGD